MNTNLQNVQTVLKYTYGLVPIVAGLDKFLNVLTNWSDYLPAAMLEMMPFSAGTLMMIVGVIEILAGVLVLFKTEIGAYVVAAWLTLIGLVLIFSGNYLDVAVRDLVMAVGAYALAKLSATELKPAM